MNQAAATASAVKSAQANLQRLRELQSFEKVYAPFDGVVTARKVDTGQLISSGSGRARTSSSTCRRSQTLRVYTNVPQLYSQTLKRGMKIDLTFPEYPGKTFEGTLVRTADAIDPASRTLLVEVDVDNRAGELMPGSLAQVHFKTPSAGPTFIVPASALIFRRDGMQVGTVVRAARDVAHLVPVVIGEDDGATVQIVSGLNAGDKVIQDPPDSLIDGEKVTVETPERTVAGRGRPVAMRAPMTPGPGARRVAEVETPVRAMCRASRQLSARCSPCRDPSAPLVACPPVSALAGCKPVGPNYNRPGYNAPSAYKETGAIRGRRLRPIRKAAHGSRRIPPTAC